MNAGAVLNQLSAVSIVIAGMEPFWKPYERNGKLTPILLQVYHFLIRKPDVLTVLISGYGYEELFKEQIV